MDQSLSIATGQHCPQSGIWQTTDACSVQGIISRSENLPNCPQCGKSTAWRLERSIPRQPLADHAVERRMDDFMGTRGPDARA